jgi:LysM repeat protein
MRKVACGAALFVAALVSVVGGQKAHAHEPQKTDEKPRVIRVRPGDSLSKIARRNKTTYPRIFYANKSIKHPDKIYPRQKLRIPRSDEELHKRPLPADSLSREDSSHEPVVRHSQKRAHSPPRSWSGNWKPVKVSLPARVASGSVWDRLAACESGGNWSINTGNGYYGGLQFSLSTWRSVGGVGYPHQAGKAEQIKRGQILQARSGWGQWPACRLKLRLG